MSDLDKYDPKLFNDSSVNPVLLTKEKNIMAIYRNNESKELYANFDSQLQSYLAKIQNANIKTYISNMISKNAIFIGNSVGKGDVLYSRVLLSQNKLGGIILDSTMLDIDIETGDTPSIDNCIYAIYLSLIRSGLLTNRNAIIQNIDLHKLVSSYIYLIFLKAIGQKMIYDKQKKIINMICVYIYFSHFLSYKQGPILSIMKNDFGDLFDKAIFQEFSTSIKKVKYTHIKEIPNVLIDLNIYNESPSKIYLELLRLFGNIGFYSLISSLDLLIGMIVISKYPSELYPKSTITSIKLHEGVETLITKYIDDLQYISVPELYK